METKRINLTCNLTLANVKAIRELKLCVTGFRALAGRSDAETGVMASRIQYITGMIELIHEWCAFDPSVSSPWDWPDFTVLQCCEAMIGLGADDTKKSETPSEPRYEVNVVPYTVSGQTTGT